MIKQLLRTFRETLDPFVNIGRVCCPLYFIVISFNIAISYIVANVRVK